MLGVAGLCSASAISSPDGAASNVPNRTSQEVIPRVSADMFADSSLTYEEVKHQSQKLEAVPDESGVSPFL